MIEKWPIYFVLAIGLIASLATVAPAASQTIRCDPFNIDTGLPEAHLPSILVTLEAAAGRALGNNGTVWALTVEPNRYLLRRTDPNGNLIAVVIVRDSGQGAFVYKTGMTPLRCYPGQRL